jgi:hypothetical protein
MSTKKQPVQNPKKAALAAQLPATAEECPPRSETNLLWQITAQQTAVNF